MASTRSVWMEYPAPRISPPTEPLDGDARADVCVIGSGITGLTTAYLLARAQRSVIVLEAGDLAAGESLRSTGHLSTALDDRYLDLLRIHGSDSARVIAQSHAAAIDRIEAICKSEGIDCGFERLDGYLWLPADTRREADLLDQELAAAQAVGLEVERVERPPLAGGEPGAALRFPNQAQIHPQAYLAALAAAFVRDGGRISTSSPVATVEGGKQARAVTRSGRRVLAEAIVVATHTPINERVLIHTKQAAYRSYVVAARIPPGSVERALYWDGSWQVGDSYHYTRMSGALAPEVEFLIVGGEDHKTGQADDGHERFARLEGWMRRHFPFAGEVAHRWSGQIIEPNDRVAFIGRNPLWDDNVLLATGDSGAGLTHGTIAGMLISDLLLDRENSWEDVYSPSRKSLRAVPEFARENLNAVAQYGDWLRACRPVEADEIAPGTGRVVQRGLKRIAVYRSPSGQWIERSAVCPHLGGIVRWNSVEKSWDCPCHGSRFDPEGRVLNGPANADLEAVEDAVDS